MKKNILLSFSAVLFLSACSMAPDYQDPLKGEALEKAVSENFFHADDMWKEVNPDSIPIKGDWWLMFNDETLNGYMATLKESNPTLKAAFYRVEQARAAACITESQLYPHLGAEGYFDRSGYSENHSQYNGVGTVNSWFIGTGLTWDLDFFGRVRNLVEAEVATAQATYAAYQNTMLLLESELATTYFSLKQYVSEEKLLKDTIDLRTQQFELVDNRYNMGSATLVDLERAKQQLFEAKAQYAAILQSKNLTMDYLALLLGSSRAKVEIAETLLDSSVPQAPEVVPSEILQRRPDIAQAERGVFAANERIGAANAAFFPTVAITASAGLNSNDFDKLFNASALAWGVSPNFYVPIFQAGKLISQRKQALFAHKEYLESYRAVVLKAINEVEDALVSIKYLDMEYNSRNEAMLASKNVSELTQKQYDLGFVDYFELSDSLRLLLLDQRSVIAIKGTQFRELIKLVVASGGSLNLAQEQ